MNSDLALCPHLSAAVAGDAPFTLAPEELLDWDGAPVEAVVRCRSCDGCGWLRLIPRDPVGPLRVYALAAVRSEDVSLYFRNRARGSCDAARARAELEALAACTGPIERLVTLRPDTLEVVAVAQPREASASAAPREAWHAALEPRGAPMFQARRIASALLLLTGVAHLLSSIAGPGATGGAATAVFGGIYFALGLALRVPAAWPLWLSVLLPALGGLGGIGELRKSFEPVMALFVAVDVVVVACCLGLIVTRRSA